MSAFASAHQAPRLLNCWGSCECQGRHCLFVHSVSGRSALHYITAKVYERREFWCHQTKWPWILHYKTDILMLKGNTQHKHQKGMFSLHCNGNWFINKCTKRWVSTLYSVPVKDIGVCLIIIISNKNTFIQWPVFPKYTFNGWWKIWNLIRSIINLQNRI